MCLSDLEIQELVDNYQLDITSWELEKEQSIYQAPMDYFSLTAYDLFDVYNKKVLLFSTDCEKCIEKLKWLGQQPDNIQRRVDLISISSYVETDINEFEELPGFEIEKIEIFDKLPDKWTYPEIQPKLIEKVNNIMVLNTEHN